MTNTKQKWKNRESGIELLRLISMFLIVVSHMIMSLCYASGYIPDSSYVLPIYNVTFNWRIITLVVRQSRYHDILYLLRMVPDQQGETG